jgi:hypothetical protein
MNGQRGAGKPRPPPNSAPWPSAASAAKFPSAPAQPAGSDVAPSVFSAARPSLGATRQPPMPALRPHAERIRGDDERALGIAAASAAAGTDDSGLGPC